MHHAFLRGLLLLLLLPLLAPAADAQTQALRLAVSRGPVSLPIYVAEAQGFFRDEGVAVDLRECASGRDCLGLLATGEAELATTAELPVVLEGFKETDVAIIATISTSARHIKLVARGGTGVRVPADLKGRRIGTVAGTSAQYFLDRWLVFHNLDPADVEVRSMAPDALAGALARQEVDAVAIWEPAASAAAAALGKDTLALPSPRVYAQHFTLVTRQRVIAQREVDLLKLLRALDSAERFIAEEPGLARALLRTRLAGAPGQDDISEHEWRLQLAQSLISTMDGEARWAIATGLGAADRRPLNLMTLIEPALLRKVSPAAVGLVR